MFQKSKINEPIDPRAGSKPAPSAPTPSVKSSGDRMAMSDKPASRGVTSASPSVIAPDLTVIGHLITNGDLQIEGTVEGDVEARGLIVGNNAHVKGEIRSNDVTVNGKVTGHIKGQKVRLASSARVDGDITHASLAMEEGADFEGSIHRAEDPLKNTQRGAGSKVMELTDTAKTGSDTPT